jgi:antitoxin component YwqK of YwqJK toxin-antitoxin module
MEGYWAMYDEEGWQSGEVTFINGLREGVVRMWHKNTLVRTEMPVLRGKPHGKKVEYSDRGDLIRSIEFEHGKKHGWDITIDPDGNKTAKYYQNGELVDPQPEYIEDEPTDKDG